MSATLNCSAWNLPISPPNASRSLIYRSDSSTQPCASPTDSAAIATRPSSSVRRNCAYPRPRSPSRFAAGTRHPEKESSRVSEAHQPTFEYFAETVNPGVPDGTRIVEISGLPSSRVPVTAATATNPVIDVPELVMNDFVPSITQCPPPASSPHGGLPPPVPPGPSPFTRRARVRIAPATSEPPPG